MAEMGMLQDIGVVSGLDGLDNLGGLAPLGGSDGLHVLNGHAPHGRDNPDHPNGLSAAESQDG